MGLKRKTHTHTTSTTNLGGCCYYRSEGVQIGQHAKSMGTASTHLSQEEDHEARQDLNYGGNKEGHAPREEDRHHICEAFLQARHDELHHPASCSATHFPLQTLSRYILTVEILRQMKILYRACHAQLVMITHVHSPKFRLPLPSNALM